MIIRGTLLLSLLALVSCGSFTPITQYSADIDNQFEMSQVQERMIEINQFSISSKMADEYLRAENRFQTAKNLLSSGSAQNPVEKLLIFRNLQQAQQLLSGIEIADSSFDENFNLVLLEDDADLLVEEDRVGTLLAAPSRETNLKSELEMAFATSEMDLETLKGNYQLRIAGLSDSSRKELSKIDKDNLRKLANSLNAHSYRSIEIEFSYPEQSYREIALKRAQMAKIYLESYLAIDEPVVRVSSLGPKNIGDGIQFKIFLD